MGMEFGKRMLAALLGFSASQDTSPVNATRMSQPEIAADTQPYDRRVDRNKFNEVLGTKDREAEEASEIAKEYRALEDEIYNNYKRVRDAIEKEPSFPHLSLPSYLSNDERVKLNTQFEQARVMWQAVYRAMTKVRDIAPNDRTVLDSYIMNANIHTRRLVNDAIVAMRTFLALDSHLRDRPLIERVQREDADAKKKSP